MLISEFPGAIPAVAAAQTNGPPGRSVTAADLHYKPKDGNHAKAMHGLPVCLILLIFEKLVRNPDFQAEERGEPCDLHGRQGRQGRQLNGGQEQDDWDEFLGISSPSGNQQETIS